MAQILAGCGMVDSLSSSPESRRATIQDSQPLDPQPDVRRLVHDKPDSLFLQGSHPTHIRISTPRREPSGPGWTVCVKADLMSVMGQPLGTQTYLTTIENNVIFDRRRSGAEDNCETETYQPL
jgi:hypothetical protein